MGFLRIDQAKRNPGEGRKSRQRIRLVGALMLANPLVASDRCWLRPHKLRRKRTGNTRGDSIAHSLTPLTYQPG